MAQKYKRTRLWIDPPFQSRILLRMGLYLLAYTLVVWHVGFVLEVLVDIARNGLRQGIAGLYVDYLKAQRPLLYAFVLTAPALLYNLLQFSHRVAGPLYRCRNVMRQMAAGNTVPVFVPRRLDLMGEFFQAFNVLIAAWNARVQAAGDPAGETTVNEMTAGEKRPPPASRAAAETQRLEV
jgi:hypothetical protein